MPEIQKTEKSRPGAMRNLLVALALIAGVLGLLFAKSFRPEMVLFSNDAPLGLVSAESGKQASTIEGLFTGYWQDLNWIGIEQPAILPSLSLGIYLILGNPVANAKFYGPLSLLVLGLSAWFFFRQLGFRNTVCVLGGLATALNMNTFSHVCWGLPSRALTQAAVFLALGALQSAGGNGRHFWIKTILGGMAVGLAVMEGFDVGAIYSLYIAAFALFIVLQKPDPIKKQLPRAAGILAVVTICAVWLATHAVYTLVGTQIKGVAGAQQDEKTRQERWDAATWWSLPKLETLRLIIPGLFGYRMDTGEGGRYWGRVGESPALPRHSGAGEYAGILVVLVAGWSVAAALNKKNGAFSDAERKQVIFWTVAGLISLLFAWGRHAPFYKLIYALPYFSTIRNPIKFTHLVHLALLILFGFGLTGLFRLYVERGSNASDNLVAQWKKWFQSVGGWERKWVFAMLGFLVASVLGFLVYYSSNRELITHLQKVGFPQPEAALISSFSYKEVGLYLVFCVLSIGAILAVMSGWFAGARWKMAALLLGGILVVDLARANQPWIVYYDYQERYARSPLFNLLSDQAHEKRVTSKLSPFSGNYLVANPQVMWFAELCNSWLQNQFQFYNIFSLDIVQMPRIPELDMTYLQNFRPANESEYYLFPRLWELTGTRLMLAQREYVDFLNQHFLPGQNAFRVHTAFTIVPRNPNTTLSAFGADDITTELNPNGPFAVLEYTTALPRTKLYTQWEVSKDDQATLAKLKDPNFRPAERVIVAEEIDPPGESTNANPASAEYVRYGPKEFTIATQSSAPGVLLVNDKYSANWRVYVDGKEQPLLRCNYIMRGVQVPEGTHQVEFRYRPPVNTLYVTLAAMAVGLGLCGYLAVSGRRQSSK